MGSDAVLIGSLGVGLLLGAFSLNLLGLVSAHGWFYLALNVAGAALSCYASYLIHYLPFVILEGTWTVVAAVAFVQALRKVTAGSLLKPVRNISRTALSIE